MVFYGLRVNPRVGGGGREVASTQLYEDRSLGYYPSTKKEEGGGGGGGFTIGETSNLTDIRRNNRTKGDHKGEKEGKKTNGIGNKQGLYISGYYKSRNLSNKNCVKHLLYRTEEGEEGGRGGEKKDQTLDVFSREAHCVLNKLTLFRSHNGSKECAARVLRDYKGNKEAFNRVRNFNIQNRREGARTSRRVGKKSNLPRGGGSRPENGKSNKIPPVSSDFQTTRKPRFGK